MPRTGRIAYVVWVISDETINPLVVEKTFEALIGGRFV